MNYIPALVKEGELRAVHGQGNEKARRGRGGRAIQVKYAMEAVKQHPPVKVHILPVGDNGSLFSVSVHPLTQYSQSNLV